MGATVLYTVAPIFVKPGLLFLAAAVKSKQ